jgi:DME family drug/metabolite transporter
MSITPDSSRRDFLFIVAASASWGTVGVTNQIINAASATNALSLAFFRLAIAAPLFGLVSWKFFNFRLARINFRDLLTMILMGAMQAISQTSYSAALPLAGVTISTLVAICAAPVLIALVSPFITRERLTPTTLIALPGALGGTILLVVAQPQAGTGTISFLGVALALLSACSYAGFILCGRLLSGNYHPLHINTVAFGTGAIFLLLFAPTTGLVLIYPAWIWLLLLYLGCVPTALAYTFFQIGIRSFSATITSLVTLCEPLTASLLAWLLFHEQLGLSGFLGGGLLLGSMAIILFGPKRKGGIAQDDATRDTISLSLNKSLADE